MTAYQTIHCVVGRFAVAIEWPECECVNWIEWPVCWRFDPQEAEAIKQVCLIEHHALVDECKPLVTNRRLAEDSIVEDYRTKNGADRQKLRNIVADCDKKIREIEARRFKAMFDPMYPLGIAGTVDYVVRAFEEDPRELPQDEILKRRAVLFGGLGE